MSERVIRYKIVRHFANKRHKRRTIFTGLTLEQAQRIVNEPEHSSTTCKTPAKRAYTRRVGYWFDAFTVEE